MSTRRGCPASGPGPAGGARRSGRGPTGGSRGSGPGPAGGARGFTLVEAVVALVLLGVMLAGILPAFAHYAQTNTRSEIRTGAVAVAQKQLDALRAVEAWPASGTEEAVEHGGREFNAVITHEPYCDDGGCYDGARRVRVEVSHRDRGVYEVETVYTRLDPTGL